MILHGHVLDMLATVPDNSVQCVVTSPPYWALRRYDIPDVVWDGDPMCEHEWGKEGERRRGGPQGPTGQRATCDTSAQDEVARTSTGAFCRCGAWLGQLGQEPTPQLFIAHLVAIFRAVRRVLRPDGTVFLNMGDCYAGSGCGGNPPDSPHQKQATNRGSLSSGSDARRGARANGRTYTALVDRNPGTDVSGTLKPKDLVGIPWALAFALRDDGWYLRSEIIWAKGLSFCESYAGSVMPESVTDRPTRSHEQVFLFTKNERYFYDAEAVKERGVYPAGTIAAKGSGTREGNRRAPRKKDVEGVRAASTERRQGGSFQDRVDAGYACYDGMRNMRTVWAIGVEPFHDAHFATFPPDLVDPCLRAGTSAKGACAACGASVKRVVDYEPMPDEIKQQFEAARTRTGEDHGRNDGFTTRRPNYQRKRTGETWVRTCECETRDIVPCTVMDPFAGSGTTGVACELLRLRFIGIELGDGYKDMAERRIGSVAPLFASDVTA